MGERRQNAEQRRLSQVRAVKAQHFSPEADFEAQLAEKDRRIAELERQVELLELKLARVRPQPETGPSAGLRQRETP